MKKHLLPLLLALCLALSLLPAAALAASEEPVANDEPAPVALDAVDPEETAADEEECADEEASADDVVTTSESDRAADEPVTLSLDGGTDTHSHPICGASCSHSGSGSHTSVTWQAWTNNDRLPSTAGRYYLTQDVTLNSGSWVVEEDIALCLNGHSITAKGNDPVINVNGNQSYSGTLTLTDCATAQGKITHTSGQNGIGVTVYGTLNMYGGSITGNTASYGGVYVDKPGSFNLYGGIIANNTATYGGGGGVTVAEKSNFIMYGGSITNNTTTKLGGGVCVKGNFTMYGGSITNNTATNAGGGVNIDGGTFSMLSGSVTGNTAKYGGGVYSAGNFYLSGSPTISENTITTDGSGNNVYLGLHRPISIINSLNNTTKIGLYSAAMDYNDTPYVDVLPGWDEEDRGSASQYFYSEREDCTLSDNGRLVKDSYEISLTPTSHTFTAATEGYGAQTPVTVTVTNTGNQPTGALTVSITGSDFTLDKTSLDSIESANGTASFTVVPKTGLDVGTHTATVTVTGGNNISASFTVSFTVNEAPAYKIELSPNPLDLGTATEGYYDYNSKKLVTINNTGNQDLSGLTMSLSGKNSGDFGLNGSQSSIMLNTIKAGGSGKYFVMPKSGLAAGTYEATITVKNNDGSINESITVTFTVEAAPTYGITLTPTSHTFTAATEGYGAQTPVTVTVTNTGNQPTGALIVSITGSDFTLDKTSLDSIESANGTASFTVVPKTDLDVGTHTATVTVMGGNNISASFTVSFTVNHTGGTEIRKAKDATCTEAGYTGDIHCKGCGVKLSDGKPITKLDHEDKNNDHVCDREGCGMTVSEHTGGTATCEAQAVCDVCGKPYGELKEHDIRHVEAKKATTEAAGNIEYWRCAACKTCFADALGKEEIKAADTVIEKLTPSTTPTETPSSGASPAPTATPAPTTAPSATSAPSAKPEQHTPKTGDEANLALWLMLATVSMTAIALVARKKAK